MTIQLNDGIVVDVFNKPSALMMHALRDFVFRHEIFVEAREFDDGFIFTRQPKAKRRSKHFSSRRHFEVFLRRGERRVHFYNLTCGGDDLQHSRVSIDFPEKALVVPTEAAIEYEKRGRSAKRWATAFPDDPDAARALFGYVRSESRLLLQLLGDSKHRELLRLVARHGRKAPGQAANRRSQAQQRRRRP